MSNQGVRMFKVALLCLFSMSTFAASWSDLEVGEKYKLTQSFQLPQIERSGSLLDFSKGEELSLTGIVPINIPGASLYMYLFDYKNCPGQTMATEMELVSVQGTFPVVEVGAVLEKNCELNIYIETRDYYTKSLFE
jgi:hypothetical protein